MKGRDDFMEEEEKSLQVFKNAPVYEAVLKNALPAMAAMLMVLIYNLADTFFIGQTHNDLMVAAVSLATPVFLMFSAVGSLFGVGGTSVISRALGEGHTDYAKKVCSFCMWSCVVVGIVMSAAFLIFMDPLLTLIGASADTWDYAKEYMIIVTLAGPFSLISNCFSNILRSEGQANKAMMGQLLGNLLNMCMDAVLIIGLGWDIFGCALATFIGELFAAAFYITFYLRKQSMLGVSIKNFTLGDGVTKNVLVIGVPASLATILMSVSQIIINSRMSAYDDMAVAGMGVAMKVVTITGMVCMGLGQGVQPLLGYCVGARNWDRFNKAFRFSLLFAFLLGAVLTILCYVFTGQIVGVFLTEQQSFDYAVQFAHILLMTSWLFGVFYVLLNALQAMGAATASLVINLSRQGIIFIPALFILEAIMGITGLVWAQPVADLISLGLALILVVKSIRGMQTA